MKKFPFLLMVLLAAGGASAQVKKFEWEDLTCLYQSAFDARVYSEKQILNTYALWRAGDDYRMDTFDAAVFKLADMPKLRTVESLDAEYRQKSEALRELEIVNVPFWRDFKAQKLVALERDYLLARASVKAYANAEALREVTFADACVARFAPPIIAGGDELLRLWREVNEENRAKNSEPERIRREFERRLASADKFRHAQVEVLTFGWWNCANAEIRRPGETGEHVAQFRKLFKTSKKKICDMP
jgi:hypothetical protein